MRTTPLICECTSCECAIYTYEDSKVCKECNSGNHLSGAKKKDFTETEPENPSA